MSSRGFRFIKGFEGFAPNAYQDSAGNWTICYGVTKHGEPDIYASLVSKQPVGEEEGAKISYKLKNERYGSKIVNAVKALGCTNQNQFDALCSLAYNCGTGVVTGSNSLTNTIRKDPNNESAIRSAWENFYVTAGGQYLSGLKARREQECNLYFGKAVEMRSIGLINTSGNVSGTVRDNGGNGWLPEEMCGDINGYKSFNNAFGKGWLCPVKGGTVTSKYGYRENPFGGGQKFHHGTDIGVPLGTDYIASKDGIVSQQGFSDSMGNYIYIDHEGGYRTRIMHLSKILTTQGQTVKRGQIVGRAGTTGSSTGVHAHWEIRRISDNQSTDPAPKLKVGGRV